MICRVQQCIHPDLIRFSNTLKHINIYIIIYVVMIQRSSTRLDWRRVLDTGPYLLVLLKDPNNVDVHNNSHDIPFLEIECVVYY